MIDSFENREAVSEDEFNDMIEDEVEELNNIDNWRDYINDHYDASEVRDMDEMKREMVMEDFITDMYEMACDIVGEDYYICDDEYEEDYEEKEEDDE